MRASTTLSIPRDHSRKTTTVADKNVAGMYVRLYTIRLGRTRAHSYARGAAEGQLGGIVGYGVSIEDADGIQVWQQETKASQDALFVHVAADPKTFLGGK